MDIKENTVSTANSVSIQLEKNATKQFKKSQTLPLRMTTWYLIIPEIFSFLVILFIALMWGKKPPELMKSSFTLLIMQIVSAIVSISIFSRMSSVSDTEALQMGNFGSDLKNALKYYGILIGYVPLSYLYQLVIDYIPMKNGFTLFPNTLEFGFPETWGTLIVLFLVTCVMAPIVEEVLFRGFLMNSILKNTGSPKMAIILSGVLFGAMHMNGFTSLLLMVMGIFFGYAVYKTGSIRVSMLMHFFNNFLALLELVVSKYFVIPSYATFIFLIPSVILIILNNKNRLHLDKSPQDSWKILLKSPYTYVLFIFVLFGFFTTFGKI